MKCCTNSELMFEMILQSARNLYTVSERPNRAQDSDKSGKDKKECREDGVLGKCDKD